MFTDFKNTSAVPPYIFQHLKEPYKGMKHSGTMVFIGSNKKVDNKAQISRKLDAKITNRNTFNGLDTWKEDDKMNFTSIAIAEHGE